MTTDRQGRLVLMPNALDLGQGDVDLRDVLAHGVLERASALQYWAVENARSARALIKRVHALVPSALTLQALSITELPRAPKGNLATMPALRSEVWDELLAPLADGHDVGLLSEAGLPGVADPGAELVAAAHRRGWPVLALSGPSSITLAVAASGLNGQSFAFVGYLPVDAGARAQRIRELESGSRRGRQTQVCIETPYRNAALLQALLETLADDTLLSVSCGLTMPQGWTRTDTVAGWKRRATTLPDRTPAVFVLLAETSPTARRR